MLLMRWMIGIVLVLVCVAENLLVLFAEILHTELLLGLFLWWLIAGLTDQQVCDQPYRRHPCLSSLSTRRVIGITKTLGRLGVAALRVCELFKRLSGHDVTTSSSPMKIEHFPTFELKNLF